MSKRFSDNCRLSPTTTVDLDISFYTSSSSSASHMMSVQSDAAMLAVSASHMSITSNSSECLGVTGCF